MKTSLLKLLLVLSIALGYTQASDITTSVIPTKHNKALTLAQIAEIQPGLGTIMIEFGHRFYLTYYAAKAGNWELAAYELHELVEAQEVAETTRPKYTKQLKAFEDDYIKPLEKAIKEKSWETFEDNYTKATIGCNACHSETGHGFIKYTLPKTPPLFPSMTP